MNKPQNKTIMQLDLVTQDVSILVLVFYMLHWLTLKNMLTLQVVQNWDSFKALSGHV